MARHDYISVFVTAGVSDNNRTINIIVTPGRPFFDTALLGAMIYHDRDKNAGPAGSKTSPGVSPTDAVVVAAEKLQSAPEMFASVLTNIGERIVKAVCQAPTEVLVWFDTYLLSSLHGLLSWYDDRNTTR
jgi:adenosylcobinamide hydrolase